VTYIWRTRVELCQGYCGAEYLKVFYNSRRAWEVGRLGGQSGSIDRKCIRIQFAFTLHRAGSNATDQRVLVQYRLL